MKNQNSPLSESILSSFLQCKDHTVSRETFFILKDETLEILITSPKPNDEELSKYYESEDYISHTDSNKTFIDKIYQKAKNYAIKKKVKLIVSLSNQDKVENQKSKTVLDIGCGTGDFLAACNKSGFLVSGIEPNKNARVRAKSKLGILTSKLDVFDDSPEIFNTINELENKKFDVITMWHVLEHVPNLLEYINKLKELLNENGRLIIAVPNYKSYDANYYKHFWAAYDVPRHLWHFSQKSISLLFKKENMLIEKTIPMKLDSFYVSLLSEKYKTKKSNYLKAFFIGLLSNFKAISTKEYSSLIYVIKNANS